MDKTEPTTAMLHDYKTGEAIRSMTTSAFLPPGVQAAVCEKLRLTRAPDEYPMAIGTRISELWARRNTAPESEIQAIDHEMEVWAVAGWTELHAKRG